MSDSPIAKLLHELGHLKRVKRSGWWLAGIEDPENVAEHSFRVAAVAYFLAQGEKVDLGRVLAMALFHDAAESRVNDSHRLARRYLAWKGVEEKVVEDQTRALPAAVRDDLRSLLAEARDKTSPEARIVKDADRIECLLQAREYAEAGYEVEEWVRSSLKELVTPSAKRLARAILKTSPRAWWKS